MVSKLKFEDFLDWIENVKMEDFEDQKKRNELFKQFSEFLANDKIREIIFNDIIDEQNSKVGGENIKKIRKFSAGLTPVEMAGLLVLDAPQSLKDKAEHNITHTYQYFGTAGKGKTFSINVALGAINGMVFNVAKRALDGEDIQKIQKDVEKFVDTLSDTFKQAGVNIDKEKFAKNFVDAALAYSKKLSESENAAKQWNESLDTISKDPEWNKLANSSEFMSKLAQIDVEKNAIDLVSILPAKPFAVFNDMYQNLTDPRAISNLMQALGEKEIPTSQFVVTSNFSEEAFRNLQETFGRNPGYKARAGVFINTDSAGVPNTLTDKWASTSFSIDKNLQVLFNELKTNGQKGRLFQAFANSKDGRNKLNALINSGKKFAQELGYNDFDELVDKINNMNDMLEGKHYKASANVHKGESLVLRALAQEAHKKGKTESFNQFKSALSAVLGEQLSLGQVIKSTSADVVVKPDDKDLDFLDALISGDEEKLNEETSKLENVKDDGFKEGQNKVKEFWGKIKDKVNKFASNFGGRFHPDIDLQSQADELVNATGDTEADKEAFRKLNHRDMCETTPEGLLKLADSAESLRHVKQTINTLNFMKQILDEDSFKAFATKYVLGTYGFNEISKSLLEVAGIGSAKLGAYTPQQLIDEFSRKITDEWDGKDGKKLVDIIKDINEAMTEGALTEKSISSLSALIEESYKSGASKIFDKLASLDENSFVDVPKEFKALAKLKDFVEELKEKDEFEDFLGELDPQDMKLFTEAAKKVENLNELKEPVEEELKKKAEETKNEMCAKTGGKATDFVKNALDKAFPSGLNKLDFYSRDLAANTLKYMS